MRKPATIVIIGLLIAAGVVIGRLPATAHAGHTITVNDASATEGAPRPSR